MANDYSSSTVSLFSDNNSLIENKETQNNYKLPQNNHLKELFDPLFINLKIKVPKKLEKIFKGVSNINFLYEIVENDYLEIIDLTDQRILYKIYTCEYDRYDFNRNDIKNIIFIFGREQFKLKCKVEQKKKYKESINKNVKFVEDGYLKDLRMRYLEYQIEKHTNFIFIEEPEIFHSQIRSIISIGKEEKGYTPKTSKFEELEKREFIKNILETIPGISEEIASLIAEIYPNINDLEEGLNNKEKFIQIGKKRNITEKVYLKIYKAFKSSNSEEKL